MCNGPYKSCIYHRTKSWKKIKQVESSVFQQSFWNTTSRTQGQCTRCYRMFKQQFLAHRHKKCNPIQHSPYHMHLSSACGCLCVKHFSFLYKGQTSLPLMLETWDLDICNPGALNFQFKATSSFV